MADAEFVQGDTAPPITATILQPDGSPKDLTSVVEVRFQMRRNKADEYQVDAPASVVDPGGGVVSYAWGPTDLAIAGLYECQWQITYAGTSRTNSAGTWTVSASDGIVTVELGQPHGFLPTDAINTDGNWTTNPFMAGLQNRPIVSLTLTSFSFALSVPNQSPTAETNTAATVTTSGRIQTTTPPNTISVRRQ